ncbi:pentapeptide repeat-containing protein [Escherichia coli]|uniref:pentapeptide repeat-containing protein n=1 Tax=Escherichia coli TaxID=562 RepID=UPI000641F5ED|nr:pentapeptide repeat-containing protein [Escherichia coli]AKK14250.1 pentapeptide repeats protein [Escherichia coli K-12]
MRYNGLNNMFFPLCLINDNHSVTSPSHTKKTKSDNYSKHHKNTLIDNKALSLFKMDDHEKVIGLIQKMKRIYDSLPSGKITKETDRKIHKYFIDIASHANNKCDDRITRRVYLNKDKEVSIKVVYFINNVTVHNNTIEIPQTVNGGYDFSHLSLKGIVIKDEDLSNSNFAGCRLQNAIFQDCNMYKTNFNFAIMEKILFDNCILDDSNFAQIKMTDGTLNSCSAMHVQFYKVIAPYINLFRADLSFSKLDLINFEHADLSRVNLNKATLQNINLIDSKLFFTRLTNTFLEMVICTDSNMANVNFNNANLSNCHFNCSVLTKAWMFNIRLYRVNFDEASVQGMGITILRGEENISINSDILVTLQKFFEEDCATHTGMSQTEDNLHAVAMKITADIMQDAD